MKTQFYRYIFLAVLHLTDSITQSELEKRNAQIKKLNQKYSSETEQRQQAENERDNFREELVRTDKMIKHNQNYLIFTVQPDIWRV